MLKSKLTTKKNNLLDMLTQKVKELEQQTVEVGHFKEQGMHYSGYSYVELMELHAFGDGVKLPARPMLAVAKSKLKRSIRRSKPVKKALEQWARSKSRNASSMVLEAVGETAAIMEKNIFGKTSAEIPANSPYTIAKKLGVKRNSPMKDTGSLKNKVAYRTSKRQSIREVR